MNIRGNRSKIIGSIVDNGILWINLLTQIRCLELYNEVKNNEK